ncbi:cap-specific mRNA (nucleoside-2'-O-)-methyltransferase 2 [Bradysia coprophila]|uniref:cap-specific mRNA (nucleoside-2'-O-)-methyltransferase 2 n=1 Tax=Bradysia coprophila TaxID=38358 RepID=UPI00187D9F4E|nr:cap-specific mRNA (nucleoside-2'-O-)-methyltransferase 2 [Bradysia coprophila]
MFRNVSDNSSGSKFTKTKYYSLRRSPPSTESSVPKSTNNRLSESVGNFFKKKFHFRKPLHWKLPLIDHIFDERQKNQTVPELLWIKSVLNHVKDQLNDYPLDTWSKYTAKRDPSSAIAWYLRTEVKAEFVTKAWCKFYECLSAFPIVKVDARGEFNSVHLCEAPGAFVAALNHYIQLNHPKSKFNWCATTLNPYYEGNSFDSAVLDDRFMLRTFDNWEFGEDFTGNITNKRNVDQLVARCRRMGKISLVTADGSVDCIECPDDQENKVHYLHFAEVVAALQILDMGGTFVLKMFTFFELTTVSLLYFLVNVFDKVDIFKPAASKHGNSEVYVICNGYQRIYKHISYVLEMANRMTHVEAPMFALDMIPKDFIEQVNDCAKMFMLCQTKAIQTNIYHFQKPECDQQQVLDLRYEIRKEYCRVYRIKSIPERMKLLYGKPCSDAGNVCGPVTAVAGSFTSRLMFKNLAKNDKMVELRARLEGIEKRFCFQNRIEPVPLTLNTRHNDILKPFYGQPIQQIVSSKFVFDQCLKLLLEIMDDTDDSLNNNVDWTSRSDSIISVDSASTDLIITIDIISYGKVQFYDRFEKDVFHQLVNAINLHSPDRIRIKNLLLMTHFTVGLIYALGCVYEEIVLTSDGEIRLNGLRAMGKNFLNNILMNRIEFVSSNPNRSVLSIVKVIFLRNSIGFNDAVMNYNNQLSLKYGKMLLDK